MCKGQILERLLDVPGQSWSWNLGHLEAVRGDTYEFVAYVGDGENDFCPCTRLGPKDLVFAKDGSVLCQVGHL